MERWAPKYGCYGTVTELGGEGDPPNEGPLQYLMNKQSGNFRTWGFYKTMPAHEGLMDRLADMPKGGGPEAAHEKVRETPLVFSDSDLFLTIENAQNGELFTPGQDPYWPTRFQAYFCR